MLLQNKKDLVISIIYVILQIALYIILLTDCFGCAYCFCYASICLSLIFALTLFNKNTSYYLMLCAFVFTLISDTFLVLELGHKDIAMTAFSVTQICYAILIALRTNNKKTNIASLIVRAVIFVIVEIVASIVVKENYDYLIFITMFYFANIILNVVFAFFTTKINWLFCVGMILFLCCDFFVGVQQMSSIMGLTSGLFYNLAHPGFNIVWFFYLPSQVLLGLSLLWKEQKKDEPRLVE